MDGDRKISPAHSGLPPLAAMRPRSASDPTPGHAGTEAADDPFSLPLGDAPGAAAARITRWLAACREPALRALRLQRLAPRLVAAAPHLTSAQRVAAMRALIEAGCGWRETFEVLAGASPALEPPVLRELMTGLCEALGGAHLAAPVRSEVVGVAVQAVGLRARPGLSPASASACVEAVFTVLGLAASSPALRQACLDDLLAAFASVPRADMEEGTLAGLVEALGLALELDGAGRALREWFFEALVDAAATGRLDAEGLAEAVTGMAGAASAGDAGGDFGPWLLDAALGTHARVGSARYVALVGACVQAQSLPVLQAETAHALAGQVLAAAPGLGPPALRDALRGLAEGVVEATQDDFDALPLAGAPHPFERALLTRVLAHLPLLPATHRTPALAGLLEGFHGEPAGEDAWHVLTGALARQLPMVAPDAVPVVVGASLQALGVAREDGPAVALFAHDLAARAAAGAPHLLPVAIERLGQALGGPPLAPEAGGALLHAVLRSAGALTPGQRGEAVQAVVHAQGAGAVAPSALDSLLARLLAAAPALDDEACVLAMQSLALGLEGPGMPLAVRERLVGWLADLPPATDRALVSLLMEGLAAGLEAADIPELHDWLVRNLPAASDPRRGERRLDLAIGLDHAAHPFEADAVAHRRRVDALLQAADGEVDEAALFPGPDRKHRPSAMA